MGARARLNAFLDAEGRYEIGQEVVPVDALKFQDSRKYPQRLKEAMPERARKVESAIREMRGGAMNDGRFGSRMRGIGARWAMIEKLFDIEARRLGLRRGGQQPSAARASGRSTRARSRWPTR